MAAPSGVEVIMTSIEDTLQRWNSNSFYEGKLLILFKSIDSALKTIQGGLMLEELQVGGVENTPGRIQGLYFRADHTAGCQQLDLIK